MSSLYIKTLFICLVIASKGYSQFWDVSAVEKLNGSVNTANAEESMPVFSTDSSTLLFVRTFDNTSIGGELDQDIWMSKKNNQGVYSNPNRVENLNNKLRNAVFGMSSNGSIYLLNSYSTKNDPIKGISKATPSGQGWNNPESIVLPGLDVDGEYYGYYISPQEDVIIISYIGSNSLGQEDLYISTKSNEMWSAPIHMGNAINSTGYEISPFLSPTKDTLYFSSNGFGGIGDADIFYSVKLGNWNSWSKPVNLGQKINSSKFDAYFSKSNKQCVWSSNRDQERSDIYFVNILTPPLLTADLIGKDVTKFTGNDGSIDLTPNGGVLPLKYSWSNGSNSEDLQQLTKGNYAVTVTDAIGQKVELKAIINEPNPPVNVVIRLPEVRYAVGKSELLVDNTINSKDSLNFVYDLLMSYPNMVLELNSHTDARGSNSANQILSDKRAAECVRYLVQEKGIDPKRLTPKGKGESLPATYKNDSGESIVLTEKYINQFKKIDPKQFEFLHQINRRTEVKILKN